MSERLLSNEWIVLRALWKSNQPLPLNAIIFHVHNEMPQIKWKYKTYHSYLRTMETKQLIACKPINNRKKCYYPLITLDDAMQIERKALLHKMGRQLSSEFGYFLLETAEEIS